MKKFDEYITMAQYHARDGKTAIKVAEFLVKALQERYEGGEFVFNLIGCLCDAFAMPLSVACSIEHWTGLFDNGEINDDELDAAFTPWINDYLRSLTLEQQNQKKFHAVWSQIRAAILFVLSHLMPLRRFALVSIQRPTIKQHHSLNIEYGSDKPSLPQYLFILRNFWRTYGGIC